MRLEGVDGIRRARDRAGKPTFVFWWLVVLSLLPFIPLIVRALV